MSIKLTRYKIIMIVLLILTLFSERTYAEDVQCVLYSFKEDFFEKFSSRGCEKPNSWSVVNYESIGVTQPDDNSATGLQTTHQSCASSFPVVFYSGGKLQVTFLAENCGAAIKVYRENTSDVVAEYNNFIKMHFLTGWSTVVLEIKSGVKEGYITFSGYCENNGFLIIDSFKYLPPGMPKSHCEFNIEQEFLEGEFILMPRSSTDKPNDLYIVRNEIVTEVEDEGSGSTPMPPAVEEDTDDEDSFWTPMTISLVTVGGFTGLGALTYGAYAIGKITAAGSGLPNVGLVESARTITLPRVRSIYDRTYGGNMSRRMY